MAEAGGEGCEVGGEASYADHKVGIEVGIFICGEELFGIEDVDINERSALLEVSFDKVEHGVYAALLDAYHGVEFYLEGRGISISALHRGDAI